MMMAAIASILLDWLSRGCGARQWGREDHEAEIISCSGVAHLA